jgi:flagellar basal-body rod protein FlgC
MNAFSIAASGMAAASLRLAVSANNVANAETAGPLPDATGAAASYAPAYAAERIDQVDISGGGVSARVSTASPGTVAAYDPTAPYADAKGMVAAPNVDLSGEVVQQLVAKYSFAANAGVMRVADQMMKSLLDVVR